MSILPPLSLTSISQPHSNLIALDSLRLEPEMLDFFNDVQSRIKQLSHDPLRNIFERGKYYSEEPPLTRKQRKLIIRVLTNLDSPALCAIKYVSENPLVTIAPIVAMYGLSIFEGASLGFLLVGCPVSLAFPPAAFPIMIGSMALGGTVGLACSIKMTSEAISEIRYSRGYQTWCKQREAFLLDAARKELIAADVVLKHYLCPLSKTLPIFPITFYAHDRSVTFELTAIEAWLRKNPGKIYPGFDVPFTVEESHFDWAHINTIRQRLTFIMSECCTDNFLKIQKFVESRFPYPISKLIGAYAANLSMYDFSREDSHHPYIEYIRGVSQEMLNSQTQMVDVLKGKLKRMEVLKIGSDEELQKFNSNLQTIDEEAQRLESQLDQRKQIVVYRERNPVLRLIKRIFGRQNPTMTRLVPYSSKFEYCTEVLWPPKVAKVEVCHSFKGPIDLLLEKINKVKHERERIKLLDNIVKGSRMSSCKSLDRAMNTNV